LNIYRSETFSLSVFYRSIDIKMRQLHIHLPSSPTDISVKQKEDRVAR